MNRWKFSRNEIRKKHVKLSLITYSQRVANTYESLCISLPNPAPWPPPFPVSCPSVVCILLFTSTWTSTNTTEYCQYEFVSQFYGCFCVNLISLTYFTRKVLSSAWINCNPSGVAHYLNYYSLYTYSWNGIYIIILRFLYKGVFHFVFKQSRKNKY